jgi:AAA domain
MKMRPDVNDVLQSEDEAAVRARIDRATKYNGPTNGQNGEKNSLRFQLKPFDAITLSTEPNYLVKGILPRTGLAVIWGPPKCGKSFWTFDIVMHVALGRNTAAGACNKEPSSISRSKAAADFTAESSRGACVIYPKAPASPFHSICSTCPSISLPIIKASFRQSARSSVDKCQFSW